MRINKLLSNYGICSRKETRKYIEDKRIIVNGQYCIQGQWVEESDKIYIDNVELKPLDKVYIAFNKPVGVTCTAAREITNNIISYINYPNYIFPIGRLDKASQGLIILTNDGDLANKVLNSENYHEKEYYVELDKDFDDNFLLAMEEGVEILGVKTRKCSISKVNSNSFNIILTQGLNKQIRRMCKALGYNVILLKRTRFVNITLEGLDIGKWRYLNEKEVNKLQY